MSHRVDIACSSNVCVVHVDGRWLRVGEVIRLCLEVVFPCHRMVVGEPVCSVQTALPDFAQVVLQVTNPDVASRWESRGVAKRSIIFDDEVQEKFRE